MSEDNSNPATTGTDVGDQLKALFAEVIAADLPPESKGRWHQRLLAITNTAKHDVGRAAEQLRRFTDEWNARSRGKEISNNESGR